LKTKTLVWGGVVVAAAVGLALTFQGLFAELQKRSASAVLFANQATTEIASGWKVETLSNLATPEYYQLVATGDRSAWDKYQILGPFISAGSCAVLGLKVSNLVAVAQVSCPAEFKNGKAAIVLLITDAGGAWKIGSMQVRI